MLVFFFWVCVCLHSYFNFNEFEECLACFNEFEDRDTYFFHCSLL
jgi:hypothetical protein